MRVIPDQATAAMALIENRQDANNHKEKKSIEVKKLEQSLSAILGAEINIKYNVRGKGKLVIAYNSLDELDGILEHIKKEKRN